MSQQSRGTRRDYPKGRKLNLDATWVDDVNTWLEREKRSFAWLAGKVGSDRSMISKLLGPPEERPNTSSLVQPIADVTGIPVPIGGFAEGSNSAALQRMMKTLRGLPDDQLELVAEMVEKVVAASKHR